MFFGIINDFDFSYRKTIVFFSVILYNRDCLDMLIIAKKKEEFKWQRNHKDC